MIAAEARVAFLRRIHLFRDLRDDDLIVVAERLKEEVFTEGATVFSQGGEADRFYIIYQGRVNITMVRKKEVLDLATLIGGDYFGEEALLSRRERSATVTTMEKTYLFSLTRLEFNAIIKQFSRLKAASTTRHSRC